MLYAAKTAIVTASVLIFAVYDKLGTVIDIIVLAAAIGVTLAYNRQKQALAASESASQSWRDERDAAVSKAERLVEENAKNIARVAALESRPDLTVLEKRIDSLKQAYVDHDKNAEDRADRIIEAIKKISITQEGGGT